MVYDNVVCDGCGEVMHEDDDIVVCPECGTPQHRECYNKNNCCVNAEKHSADFVWQAPKKPHEIELEKMEDDSSDGEKTQGEARPPVVLINPVMGDNFEEVFMRGVSQKPDDEIDGAKVRDAVVYVQSSAPRYIGKFKKSEGKKHFVSWNWAAFFFSPYWFFYRKMYKLGFIFLGLFIAMNIASVYPMDKISPEMESLSALNQEYREKISSSDTDGVEQLYMEYAAKAMPIVKKTAPTTLLSFLVIFVAPNTVAALIANSEYKKKMLTDINISHKGSTDRKLVTLSIIRKGGVSLVAGMGSILVGELLPNIIVSIINKIIL